jgi:soluble lytic murein transglycosylase-like protein
LLLTLLCLDPLPLLAGEQQYEELSHAVAVALSSAVMERGEPQPIWDSLEHKVAWLTAMADKLPVRHKPTYVDRREFLHTVRYEAQRAGLEPELVLGLIEVESGFRRYAVSSAGALGYMQVMPFWTVLIGNGDERALLDMVTNIRYGCVILRHYLDLENGNLFLALGRYNGSRGRGEYPHAVLASWQRWKFRSPAAAGTGATPAASVPAQPATAVPAEPAVVLPATPEDAIR